MVVTGEVEMLVSWSGAVPGEGTVDVETAGRAPTHNVIQDSTSTVWLRRNRTPFTRNDNLKALISA